MNTQGFKTGSLTSLGYKASKPATARHTALNKAIRKYGKTKVTQKLTAVAILNKNRPVGRVFNSDKKYVMRK